MDEIKARYWKLGHYIRTVKPNPLDKAFEALGESPSPEAIKNFEKRLTAAEARQKEKVDPYLPVLRAKMDIMKAIKEHPQYNPKRFSGNLTRTFVACEKKLDAFKLNAEGDVIEGSPVKRPVEEINTSLLEKLWMDYLRENAPAEPLLVDKAQLETFACNAKKFFADWGPVIHSNQADMEKKERLSTIIATLTAHLAQHPDELVDLREADRLGAELMNLTNQPAALAAKCKGKCKGRGGNPSIFGLCPDCAVDKMENAFSEIKARFDDWSTEVGASEAYSIEHGPYSDFQEAFHRFERKKIPKNYAELEKIYKKLDEALPPLEESEEEEEEEESEEELSLESDEEEEEEDDSSSIHRTKKRGRVTIGDILSIVQTVDSPLVKELVEAYDEANDSEEFQDKFKKIKQSSISTFKVYIFYKAFNKDLPDLCTEPNVFFTRDEAEARGKKLLSELDTKNELAYRIVEQAPEKNK